MFNIRPTITFNRLFSYQNYLIAVSTISLLLAVGDRVWIQLIDGDVIMRRGSRSELPDPQFSGVCFTSWVWLISARVLLVALNISFFTAMWVIPNVLEEFVPCRYEMNVRYTNWLAHRFTGVWLIAVPAVLHVIVLLLPTVTDTIPMELKFDGFDWSNWWDPFVKTFQKYVTYENVFLTWDEIFRLVLIILIFCFMLPLSRSNWMLRKSYSIAMSMHAFVGFAFMVDMVRKNSHPLCWRFNFPFIILYSLDRIFATFFYRVNRFSVHRIIECSESTYILLGRLEGLEWKQQGCADNFWLLHRFHKCHLCTPIFQRAHPYTAFQNAQSYCQHVWNVGFVINTNKANKNSWSLWLKERYYGLSDYEHKQN